LPDPVLTQLFQQYRPDVSSTDQGMLLALAEGSIGRALELAAGAGLEISDFINSILKTVPKVDYELIHGFAERLARAGGEDAFALFSELLPAQLARMIAGQGEGAVRDPALQRLLARRSLDQWVAVWEKLTHL